VTGSQPIRAAFVFTGGASHWTGGLNYLRNALRALRRHAADEVEPVLFLSPEVAAEDGAMLAGETAAAPLRATWLAADRRSGRLRDALMRGRDVVAERAFRDSGVDVVFEAGEFFGTRFPIPALTWVADFQSHHLPQFFSWRARWRTYLGRRMQLAGRRMILLSSRDAERDCMYFYPRSRGRTLVVPFAVPQPEGIVAEPSVPLRHGLPARYFYLPNQFWKHKNHGVVIEALALASREADDMVVAASGSPVDHRSPGYFAELQARAAAVGVATSFRFLGLVPAQDVPQLALQSVAVINPSLFEGWSTTVEEAKSLGVPLLLSDIAVHREQAGDRARYFAPRSTRDCAEALLAAWRSPDDAPDRRLVSSRASAVERSQEFGQRLAAALKRTAALGSGGGTA
jgi:glycosyltransferase involved in cell wall biosynthesis